MRHALNRNQASRLKNVGAQNFGVGDHIPGTGTHLASIRGHQVVSLFKNAGMYVVYLCKIMAK